MRFRISHPLAIDDETIFVATGRERGVFPPISRTGRMQHFGFGLPRIEGPRHAHRSSGGMREFKVDGHQVASGIRGVVVIVCVFHGGFLGDGKWLFADRCSISRSHDARGASFLLWGVTLPLQIVPSFGIDWHPLSAAISRVMIIVFKLSSAAENPRAWLMHQAKH